MRLDEIKIGDVVRIEGSDGKIKPLPATVVGIDDFGTVTVSRRNAPGKVFEYHADWLHSVDNL